MPFTSNKPDSFPFSCGVLQLSSLSVVLGMMCLSGAVLAAESQPSLLRMSIEDLMTARVISVSKHEENLFDTPSAVSVLQGDEVIRAGAHNLPDALRLVPGLNVAQADGMTWSISARGFNDQYANKLLVLIDGRSVYTPLFSGVFWDLQDVVLEDLDRIEVIRGPGSTLWGANAINGIINVSSKSSKDTQGFLLRGGGGDSLLASTALRYGGKAGDKLFYRVSGQYALSSLPADALHSDPKWERLLGGARLDWEPSDATTLTLQSDFGSSQADQTARLWTLQPPYLLVSHDDTPRRSLNVLGRLTHRFSEDSEVIWQSYADGVNDPVGDLGAGSRVRSYDTDVRHRFLLGDRHEISWGGGFRHQTARITPSLNARFVGDDRQSLDTANGFVQDKIDLVHDTLSFTVGSKVEHNNLSGVDLLPNGRLAWQITDGQTLWGAVSHGARTPSLFEDDIVAAGAVIPQPPPGLPVVVELAGSHEAKSETIDAFEIGYRVELAKGLTLDVAAFHNRYDRLLTIEPGAPELRGSPLPEYVAQPMRVGNNASGHSTGGEIQLDWHATDYWQLKAHASFNRVSIETDPGSGDTTAVAAEGKSPRFQFLVENSFVLPYQLRANLIVRHVSSLLDGGVPSYVACDTRLAWEFRPGCELAITGRNLFDPLHPEFGSATVRTTPYAEVPRSVFASLTMRF